MSSSNRKRGLLEQKAVTDSGCRRCQSVSGAVHRLLQMALLLKQEQNNDHEQEKESILFLPSARRLSVLRLTLHTSTSSQATQGARRLGLSRVSVR